MSTAESKPKVAIARLGQMVIWKPERDAILSDCAPAVVTRQGNPVSLAILPPDSRSFSIRDGVRHIDDPELGKYAHLGNGCWVAVNDPRILAAQES